MEDKEKITNEKQRINVIETTKMPGGITGKGFKPGESGNPEGRPKGTGHKLLSTLLREALEREADVEIEYPDKDGTIIKKKVTLADAVIWRMSKIAVGGSDKESIKAIAEIFDRDEGKARGSLNIGLEREIEGVDITIIHATKNDIDSSVPKEPGEQGEDNVERRGS